MMPHENSLIFFSLLRFSGDREAEINRWIQKKRTQCGNGPLCLLPPVIFLKQHQKYIPWQEIPRSGQDKIPGLTFSDGETRGSYFGWAPREIEELNRLRNQLPGEPIKDLPWPLVLAGQWPHHQSHSTEQLPQKKDFQDSPPFTEINSWQLCLWAIRFQGPPTWEKGIPSLEWSQLWHLPRRKGFTNLIK